MSQSRSILLKLMLILGCGIVAGGGVTCDLPGSVGLSFTKYEVDDDDHVVIVDDDYGDYYYDPYCCCCW
jgi:hypothetical protein